MQKFHYIVGLAGVGLLVIGLVWLTRPHASLQANLPHDPALKQSIVSPTGPFAPQDTAEPEAVQREDLEAMQDQLAALRQQLGIELTALRQQLGSLHHEPHIGNQRRDDPVRTEAASVDGQPVQDAAGDEQPDEVRARAQMNEFVDRLEGVLADEAVDSAWSAWAEEEIKFGIESRDLKGATLVDAACRSTVCRVEVAFDAQETRNQALESLPFLIPWDGQGFFQVDGEVNTVVIYVAREGESLAK